ncbi:helix-turn-helix domain-containing protein [Tsukamurella spumae]|uniref:Helix-turn-helix transcriptional regulator n=1 Tax=Tsukamurella spumae TaxID=44753 RepID=A0A846X2Z9_9ACTN|nr:helix-turn-helix transcriptional regulator [Tsukamurella spumae]NKY19724.1 helix-turn-helix transcriptional regulator [Tsukamurella spumae]
MSPSRLPADVQYLMRHRVVLAGAVEDTHAEYAARVQAQARERRQREDREREQWARYRRLADDGAETVGTRITRERERLHMSVDDLAEAAGMYEVEVEMVEAGEATVSAQQLADIAEALFTSVGVLDGTEPARV